jgi:hypothetical protein
MSDVDKSIENRFKTESTDSVPQELAPIPTGGRIYPIGSPLHMRTTIPIRCMTAYDENILNNRANLKQGTALDKLIAALVVDKTIDLGELIVGDKNALLLFARIIGYGATYDVDDFKCDSCNKAFTATVHLDKLDIRKLTDAPIEEGKNLFAFTLPKTKKVAKFHLLTAKDDAEIDQAEENKKKAKGVVLQAEPITTRLIHQIDEIEGVEAKDKVNFINNMPAYDSAAIRGHIDDITPGPVMKQDIVCKHCGDTKEQVIPIGIGFFWPKGLA